LLGKVHGLGRVTRRIVGEKLELAPIDASAPLIWSIANPTPWFSAMAAEDRGRVSDESHPIRIGRLSAASAGVM
jgi:hypothetical protein